MTKLLHMTNLQCMLSCCDLRCFDATSISPHFTHSCVEQKLIQKACLWRKNDNYRVWLLHHINFFSTWNLWIHLKKKTQAYHGVYTGVEEIRSLLISFKTRKVKSWNMKQICVTQNLELINDGHEKFPLWKRHCWNPKKKRRNVSEIQVWAESRIYYFLKRIQSFLVKSGWVSRF